jgi:hypothetical protein
VQKCWWLVGGKEKAGSCRSVSLCADDALLTLYQSSFWSECRRFR